MCLSSANPDPRWQLPNSKRGGRIFGLYMISFFSSSWVQCIGMGTSNVAGYTKKATYAAGTFIGYALGNCVGALMFDACVSPLLACLLVHAVQRADPYDNSFTGVMICFVVCVAVAMLLRFLLARENARRDREYGAPNIIHGLEDLTDKENKSFRYNL